MQQEADPQAGGPRDALANSSSATSAALSASCGCMRVSSQARVFSKVCKAPQRHHLLSAVLVKQRQPVFNSHRPSPSHLLRLPQQRRKPLALSCSSLPLALDALLLFLLLHNTGGPVLYLVEKVVIGSDWDLQRHCIPSACASAAHIFRYEPACLQCGWLAGR